MVFRHYLPLDKMVLYSLKEEYFQILCKYANKLYLLLVSIKVNIMEGSFPIL